MLYNWLISNALRKAVFYRAKGVLLWCEKRLFTMRKAAF